MNRLQRLIVRSLVVSSLFLGCGAPLDVRGPPSPERSAGEAALPGAPKGSAESAISWSAPALPEVHGFVDLSLVGKRDWGLSCALKESGELLCWGRGGIPFSTAEARAKPEIVPGVADGVQVAIGPGILVRRKTGGVICLGCGDKPIELAEPKDAVDISMRGNHACVLSASGAAFCGKPGELSVVKGLTDVVDVATNEAKTCALRRSREVICWLNGDLPDVSAGRVPGIDDAVAVSVGLLHSCVLRASGRVACWGSDAEGALGDGESTGSNDGDKGVVEVVGISDAIGLSESAECALRKGGAASCWG
jgi:hypothetical protein